MSLLPVWVVVVGYPGSGKSSLVSEALGPVRSVEEISIGRLRAPVLHHDRADQIGRDRGAFSGTDALPMNFAGTLRTLLDADFDQWLDGPIVAEGDRLGTGQTLDDLASRGREVELVLLDVPWEIAETRRRERADSTPSPQWLLGRRTKVDNLRPRATLVLDGTQELADVASDLSERILS